MVILHPAIRFRDPLDSPDGKLTQLPRIGETRVECHIVQSKFLGYEDWYEVADWAALGVLNATAVSASVRPDHDAVAELAGGGAGGLYGLLRRASTDPANHTLAVWAVKPRHVSYRDFVAGLEMFPADCALWQRQMVLGPAPEFCVAGPEPLIRELGGAVLMATTIGSPRADILTELQAQPVMWRPAVALPNNVVSTPQHAGDGQRGRNVRRPPNPHHHARLLVTPHTSRRLQ